MPGVRPIQTIVFQCLLAQSTGDRGDTIVDYSGLMQFDDWLSQCLMPSASQYEDSYRALAIPRLPSAAFDALYERESSPAVAR